MSIIHIIQFPQEFGWGQRKQETSTSIGQCDNDKRKQYKYVCIITDQPDTKSNPNPNSTTKRYAIVNIQLNIVACIMYPDKFIRDNVVSPFVLFSIIIVTLPLKGHDATEGLLLTYWLTLNLANFASYRIKIYQHQPTRNNIKTSLIFYSEWHISKEWHGD